MKRIFALLMALVLLAASVPALAEPQYHLVKLTDAELQNSDLSARKPFYPYQNNFDGNWFTPNMDDPVFVKNSHILVDLTAELGDGWAIIVAYKNGMVLVAGEEGIPEAYVSLEPLSSLGLGLDTYIIEKIPGTGDETPLFALTALALTSAAALIALSRRRRRFA